MAIQSEEVLSAALRVLDREGLDGLSMRVLARELEIQAPSLYWHFKNKQSLIDALTDALLEDVAREIDPAAPWDVVMAQVAHELRGALASHRDGARVFGGTYAVTRNVLRVAELMMAALRKAGASVEVAAWGSLSVTYFVIGFVIEEQDLNQKGGRATVNIPARRKEILGFASANFPAVLEAMPALFDQDFERRFDFGLNLLIEGLRTQTKKSRTPGRRAQSTRPVRPRLLEMRGTSRRRV